VVFTARVGENDPGVKTLSLQGLEQLGIVVDDKRNRSAGHGERFVSPDGAQVPVLVVPTDEEIEISEQALAVVGSSRRVTPDTTAHGDTALYSPRRPVPPVGAPDRGVRRRERVQRSHRTRERRRGAKGFLGIGTALIVGIGLRLVAVAVVGTVLVAPDVVRGLPSGPPRG
jgi:hypothetical protein